MRSVPASLATILLLGVTLFSVGPQFGSLDVDGDGVPDVPIVVLHDSNNPSVQSDGQTNVGLAPASPFLVVILDDTVLMKERIVVQPRASGVTSVVPLRC